MDKDNVRIPCVLMRGGTSRGLIFKDIDLPVDQYTREQVILKVYGSSANGQIDGIGGGTSVTSKVAIVGKSDTQNCDIYYTFGQVSINEQEIDYNVTCGNMASAVGLYAVEEGLVERHEGETTVKIFNTNTNKLMEVDIPVVEGAVEHKGDFAIAGVEGTGAKITVSFLDSTGAFTGHLFPTGNLVDQIEANDTVYEVSILDTGNIVAFVKASDFGLRGCELAATINKPTISQKIEALRVQVGILLGMFHEEQQINPQVSALPKITLISEPQNYETELGTYNNKEDVDIVGRYMSMGKLHPSFAVSGSICLATATKISGTIPHAVARSTQANTIRIGHPSGSIAAEVFVENNESDYKLIKGGTGRTARRIMEGTAVIPAYLIR